jgi:tryptophan halogenase
MVGLSAALAFRRALPEAEINVVEIATNPAALADRLPAAWPSLAQFHAAIEVDELELLQRGIATHHVGTIFENWPDGRSWVHGFGAHGKPVGAVHFDQIWLQAHMAGDARSYEEYSAANVLARAGKFVHPSRDPDSVTSQYAYGLMLEPDLYREHLREKATGLGVRILKAGVASVEKHSSDSVRAVVLAEGQRLEADLFIDCGGPAGLLIREVEETFEDWPSHGAKSLIIEAVENDTPTPVARVTATNSGWIAEWPLRNRTVRCAAGDLDEPDAVTIRPGRRTRSWAGNVLALGDAAIAIDPLYGLNLALAHRALFLALELLPGCDFNPIELAEFNRRWRIITDQARDLVALLYTGSGSELPDSLARRLDQYGHRGRLPYQEDEVLNRDDWTSALIGMGMVPRNADPAAAAIPLDRATEAMNRIADELLEFAARASAYPDYLAHIIRAR